MALNIIQLHDREDDCLVAVSVDSEYSGILVYCINSHGDKVSFTVDGQLFKYLCNKVSKTIKSTAKNRNACGDVIDAAL